MLVVRDLMKQYVTDGRARTLFRDLSFNLPRDGRLAILGRNGQGKSTLLKILGGVLEPTAGDARWSMTSSWPLGFGGAFQGGMTGLDNIRFLARIYNRSAKELIEGVEDFSQLGEALKMPVRLYSTGMRARLAFGLSIAIEFDCYLIDEVVAVGDALFTLKCQEELFNRRKHRAFIIASHDLEFLRQNCTYAILIESGRAKLFDDIDLAIEIYTSVWEERHVLMETPNAADISVSLL
jgi:capsular polysaccharide transport system ATP-binding protein